jgi:surface antigen
MIPKYLLRGVVLAAALAFTAPAMAINWMFMQDTPYTHFTKEDHKIFNELLNGILNSGADGESRTWSNPKSKANGELKVVKSFERDSTPCRTLAITNHAKGRSASGEYNFCKKPSGEWKMVQ